MNLKIFIILACATLLFACRPTEPLTVLNGSALGTIYQVSMKGTVPEDLRTQLDSLFDAADKSMSIFNSDSRLSRINRNLTDTSDTYINYCIELARGVSQLSDGAYDITVKPLVDAFGFSGDKEADKVNLDSLLRSVGYDKIRIDGNRIVKQTQGVQIDLNSVAKGAIVDMTAKLLEKNGIDEYLVDIGGEIFCRGTNAKGKSWTVGIETPFEGNYSLSGDYLYTTVSLSGMGLATSGNYRNFHTDSQGNKVTHIINPKTGESTASNLLSATVIAPTCALADAYGTMFISLGLESSKELMERENIAALLIYAEQNGEMKTISSKAMKQYLNDK